MMAKVLDKDFIKLDGSITVKTAVDEVKSIADKNIKNSAYYNVLVAEALWQFLNDNDFVNCEPHNLRASSRFLSEFEVTDIQLPNLSIYVRAVYDEDLLFIPKKHFLSKITPDIYLFVKVDEKLESGEVLGYVYPEQINKKNDNGQYYFVNKSFLKPFSELLTLIKTKEIKEQYLITDKAEETLEKFIMLYVDHDIDNLKFEKLIDYLKNSAVAREKLIEFENFEKLSYMAFNEFENLDVENNSFSKYIKSLVSVDEFSDFNVDDMKTVTEDATPVAGLFIDDDLIQGEVTDIESEDIQLSDEDIQVEEDEIQPEDVQIIEDHQISSETNISEEIDENKESEYKDEFDVFDNPDDDGFDSDDLLLNPEMEDSISDDEEITLPDDTLVSDVTDENLVSGTSDEQIEVSDVIADDLDVGLSESEDNIPEISDDELMTDGEVQLSEDKDIITDNSEVELSDAIEDELNPEISEEVAVTDDAVQLTDEDALVIDSPEIEDETVPELTEETVVTDDAVQLSDDDEIIIDNPEIEVSNQVEDETVPETNEEVVAAEDTVQLSDDEDIVLDDISLDMGTDENNENDAPVIEDNIITDEEDINITDEEMNIDEALNGQVFEDDELSDLDLVSDEQVDSVIGEANMEISEPTVDFVSDDDETTISGVVKSDDEAGVVNDEEISVSQNETSDVVLEDEDDTVVAEVPEQEDDSISDIDDILADITGGYSDTDMTDIAASIGKSSESGLNDIYSNDSNETLPEAFAPTTQADNTSEGLSDRSFAFASGQGGGMSKKLVACVASGILILCIIGIGAWFMLSHNSKSSVSDNVTVDNSGNTTTPNVNIDDMAVEQKQNNDIDMSDIQTDVQVPAQPVKTDDDSKPAPQLTIQKIKKDFSQPDSYLSVSKIVWDIPEYMTYNDEFNTYLQTVGNSMKVNISSDLLLVSENPVLNSIKLKIALKNNGTTLAIDVTQGCGVKAIDDLVLQSVKKTMNIIKPPASGLETADEDLYLTICL